TRCSALVSRTRAILSDDIVVLNSNCNRLAVTEAVCRGMTSSACVIGMQASGFIKPQQPAEVGQLDINWPTETNRQSGLDIAGETGRTENRHQLIVNSRRCRLYADGHRHQCQHRGEGNREQLVSERHLDLLVSQSGCCLPRIHWTDTASSSRSKSLVGQVRN